MSSNTHDEERGLFSRLDGWGAPIAGILIVLLLLVGISVNRAEATDESSEACSGEACEDERESHWGFERHNKRFHHADRDRGHRGWGRRHDVEYNTSDPALRNDYSIDDPPIVEG